MPRVSSPVGRFVCPLVVAAAFAASHAPAATAPRPVVYSARDLAKVMDFTKLPVMPGSKVSRGGSAALELLVPGTVAEVVAFYRKTFAGLGWKPELGPGGKVIDDDTAGAASSTLWKDGFCLSLSVFAFGEKDPATVSLQFLGNLDTRTLPRVDGSRKLYESQTQTIFTTEVSVGKAELALAKALTDEGWQGFSAVGARTGAKAGEQRFLDFRKQGYAVHVQIGPAPAEGNRTAVHYSVLALSHELPAPPEATDVRFTDERWEMRCSVPRDLKAVAGFYKQAMPAAGYTPATWEAATASRVSFRFETEAKDVVLVELTAADGKTAVEVIGAPAAVVAGAKKRDGKK